MRRKYLQLARSETRHQLQMDMNWKSASGQAARPADLDPNVWDEYGQLES